jgi:outer membrane protein TolC
LNFAIPILDGGRNNARMNVAREQQKFNDFSNQNDLVNFEQEISNAVRNFSQIRNAIDIALKRQEIALKRFDISNSRYLAGKVDILDLSNARISKDASIRGYIGALRQYWDAYYELRTLTLYDFQNRVLLYNPLLEYDPKTDTAIIKESK